MAVEAQRKEDLMGEFERVPSNISVHGEKDEDDDYYSYSDSVDEMRSENSWSDSSPQDSSPQVLVLSLKVFACFFKVFALFGLF